MNTSFFRTAQGEIAEQMVHQPALAAGMNTRKVGLIIAASIIAAMAISTSQEARAGDAISPYARTQDAVSAEQQRQAIDAANQRAREAQQAAQRNANDQQQSSSVLGNLIGNGVRGAMSVVSRDSNSANAAGNVADNIARQATDGKPANRTAIVGAVAGLSSVATALLSDPKNRTRNGALAGLLGGGAAYVFTSPSDPQPAANPSQQPGGSQANGPTQRQLVVYDPAALGMPTVVVKAARDMGGIGLVAPGGRPYEAGQPMLISLEKAEVGVEAALNLRAQAQSTLDDNRIGQDPSSQVLAKSVHEMDTAERRLAQTTAVWIELRNAAAASGGYDVTRSDKRIVTSFAQSYRADGRQNYKVNAVQATGYSVRP